MLGLHILIFQGYMNPVLEHNGRLMLLSLNPESLRNVHYTSLAPDLTRLCFSCKTFQGAGLAIIALKPTSCLHPSFAFNR